MRCSIIGGSYLGRFVGLDGQECVNLYPEISASAESKNVASLIGTPGLKLLANNGSYGCRGLFVTARDRLLVILGADLYEVLTDYTYINRGLLKTFYGPVSFTEIDKQPDPISAPVSQVMLVDGVAGYIFNTQTNVFSQIAGDYLPGTCVTSQNGFFIQLLNDSNKFIYSNYLDGLTWEASFNYFTAESSPDPILYITLLNNQLWLMGSKTIEIWNYTGVADQLWTRSGVGYINTGIAGKYAVTTINGHIFWLGSNQGQHMIWHSGGSYAPEAVSTTAIEYIIGKMDEIDDCIAMSYEQEGHQFVVFNFISGNRTLCYDINTQLWHERGSLNVSTGVNDRHRATYVAIWQNKVIVADKDNANLYEWSLDQYTDNGRLIQRVRTAPHIHNERKRIRFHQLEVDAVKGYGLTESQFGDNPQMMLTYSNDGGYNYSSNHIWKSSGKTGDRLIRIKWNKLGQSRDRIFRLTMTDPIRWCLIDARMDITAEPI